MATVLFFFALWGLYKAARAAQRHGRRRVKPTPTTAPADALRRNLATLDALQRQRGELAEQLEIINAALDAAPPEAQRMKWLKERSRVYGQLATVESKISKLVG